MKKYGERSLTMMAEPINKSKDDKTLVHTLLFMFRQSQDMTYALNFLNSLKNSTYKTIVIYNQGYISNEQLKNLLSPYPLDFHIIGGGINVGTSVGRQKCFDYIWNTMPNTKYISELHLDMIFANNWEDPLVSYLEANDEPLVCCGIVDKSGHMPFIEKKIEMPENTLEYPDFLKTLSTDHIIRGFTNPCIHVSEILKNAGGYNTDFLKGLQCFEDDSMLLGYYYYYGSKRNWHPKVNFNSIVYHVVAGQRWSAEGNADDNYKGLIKQYGFMGLKALSNLHASPWHIKFFSDQYEKGIKD